MKSTPIIMTAESVREILADPPRKFQTRRLMTPQPDPRGTGYYFDAYCSEQRTAINPRGMSDEWCWWTADHRPAPSTMIRCPYGQPGDRLWCKEAWHTGRSLDKLTPAEIGDRAIDAGYATPWAPIKFVADGHKLNADVLGDFGDRWGRVRSPLHLPRWASRLTLEIVEIRVQRLQAINEDDAKAEGVRELPLQEGEPGAWWTYDVTAGAELHGRDPVAAYRKAWDRINGRRRRREHVPLGEPGHGRPRTVVDESARWAANPWVWAVTFRRLP